MSSEVRVPALPESVADATVLTWHKQPGDTVRKDDNLVDLETDKVVLEVPAPMDGVLAEHKVAEGARGRGGCDPGPDRRRRRRRRGTHRASASSPPATAPASPQPAAADHQDPQLAPAARRLVKELGLDADQIPGSGKDGRIHKADVMSWLDRNEREAPERRSRGRGNARC